MIYIIYMMHIRTLWGLQRTVWNIENVQWAAVLLMKMPKFRREWPDCFGKATVTQIPACYNQDMHKSISERTTHWSLKQVGYSSRKPHRVLPLWPKNRNLSSHRLTRSWKLGVWKDVSWSDESQFLRQHSDVGVITWCRKMISPQYPQCSENLGKYWYWIWSQFHIGTDGLPQTHPCEDLALPIDCDDHQFIIINRWI